MHIYYFERIHKMKEESGTVENSANKIQEEVVETVEETVGEVVETAEENIKDIVATAEEEVEEVEEVVAAPVQKMKKHDEAISLVKKAKTIVKESDDQMEACKLLLSDDLKGYEEAKAALKKGGLDESEALLAALKYTENSEEESEEKDMVAFEAKEDLDPIVLQDVSSGKFTGFLLALIAGVVALVGFLFFVTQKLGIALDVTKVPGNETIQSIFGWVGTQIGRPDDAVNGGLLVGAVLLLIMFIVYIIRVSSKSSKNLHFANKQLEDAETYTAHKSNCKEEMDKVDTHIQDVIATLKTYEVLFNEQKGKLQRILHIEGEKEILSEYHEKSLLEMKDTQEMIDTIKEFIATPMSEEGKLSGKSGLFLHRAKSRMEKVIERLY